MSDVAVAFNQAKYSLISLSRNKRAVLFTVLLPVFLLVLFASVFGGDSTTTVGGQKIAVDAYFTAGMIAYALTSASFTTLAITLTTMRESGTLKRVRGTPIPGWTFILAQIIRSLVLVVVMVIVLSLVARFAFGVEVFKQSTTGMIVYLVLGTATMCTLGIGLTNVAIIAAWGVVGLVIAARWFVWEPKTANG